MASKSLSRSLFQSLSEWMTNRTSGVVFVTTARKRVLCLNLTNGRITFCAGAGAHALDAVIELAHADVMSFSLKPVDAYPYRMRDEVEHLAALAALEDRFREAGHTITGLRPDDTQAAEPGKADTLAKGTHQRFYVSARGSIPTNKKPPINAGHDGLGS